MNEQNEIPIPLRNVPISTELWTWLATESKRQRRTRPMLVQIALEEYQRACDETRREDRA
jgi:hypothetical protein